MLPCCNVRYQIFANFLSKSFKMISTSNTLVEMKLVLIIATLAWSCHCAQVQILLCPNTRASTTHGSVLVKDYGLTQLKITEIEALESPTSLYELEYSCSAKLNLEGDMDTRQYVLTFESNLTLPRGESSMNFDNLDKYCLKTKVSEKELMAGSIVIWQNAQDHQECLKGHRMAIIFGWFKQGHLYPRSIDFLGLHSINADHQEPRPTITKKTCIRSNNVSLFIDFSTCADGQDQVASQGVDVKPILWLFYLLLSLRYIMN